MRLVFDDRALADLEGIFEWIAKDSPAAAKAVVNRLFSSVELLGTFPFTIEVLIDFVDHGS